MSYSDPIYGHYGLKGLNFVSGAGTRYIKPPKGCDAGRIVDIHVSVTTTFTAPTTQGFVNIGTAADPDKYASLGMGTAAANTAYNVRDYPSAIFPGGISLSRDGVSVIQYTVVAPTGSGAAGVGDIDITIAWS